MYRLIYIRGCEAQKAVGSVRMPDTTSPLVLDANAMRIHLMNTVQMYGGQRQMALRFGLSQRELSMAINGLRPVSKSVALALGFDRFVEPRKVRFRRRPR